MASEPMVHVIDDDEAVRAFARLPARLRRATACAPTPRPSSSSTAVAAARAGLHRHRRADAGDERPRAGRAAEARWGSTEPVIVITGHADVPLAVEAMKAGRRRLHREAVHDDAILGAIRIALCARSEGAARSEAERQQVLGRARDACRRASARCWTAWSRARPTR